ncbi:TPA: Asp-tRNA(Asn)/Glu-tRNA(Gln) amidotransferase subunit GatB [Patescibacteria group bacterium]|nr:MAG: Aspartyl/glutamyl-tRNA(Asn/Gln) amidotransferase subunit B [Parcubacteria group bacterium GW2011_GWA2_40_143]HCI04436.1 Asp-tRNA(Asn)/Glu-tRNA(Gln) amidotransferase subunit GatB [Patescibacteria group bacterium]
MNYIPTIGLEIHAELKTKTKMFCDSANDPDEKKPNANVCPVCMAHPGSLPVANKEAIRKVLMVGKALGGKLAEYSRFDRKNYFYPDIPKGYQISQYKFPLVEGGELEGIRITRVHLEEDTGKLMHAQDGSSSLVDFNRAGVPLMELVTEPDIKSGEQAKRFGEELQLILRYLGVSDADMEKGQMRVEVNISLRESGGEDFVPLRTDITGNSTGTKILPAIKLGTKVEIKNLNSFRAVERSVAFEIKRQAGLLEKGEKITQETRGWDESKQETFSQREKEEAHDYRYFPDPDLPPLDIPGLNLDLSLPELPSEKRKKFKDKYGIKDEAIEIFVRDFTIGKFFEAVISDLNIGSGGDFVPLRTDEEGNPTETKITPASSMALVSLVTNYIISDLVGLMKEKNIKFDNFKISSEMFAKLINIVGKGEISSRVAKDVLKIMFEYGGDPEEIVKEKGLKQTSDEGAIKAIVDQVIKENPAVAEDYKNGKENALQFLVGQGMKISRGSANPGILREEFLLALK